MITDVNGKAVYQTTQVDSSGVSTVGYPAGQYILRVVYSDGSTASEKIVLTR
ncbi:hypothetical protein DSL64_04125 [Dyadobacter luteus]|jgi:hypothetical protein|uniref:Secretion system C-terminal sorting domain-containing protein n=1 Tax=Dyadobacter luteus TaxID=2259619 RepID=A0A3D8YGF1_9BACT|nr:hypothetical protein DSL64_04125 [Dyadobacter luteus]